MQTQGEHAVFMTVPPICFLDPMAVGRERHDLKLSENLTRHFHFLQPRVLGTMGLSTNSTTTVRSSISCCFVVVNPFSKGPHRLGQQQGTFASFLEEM
mmetsp:Transcript_20281/g.46959  ORF Transcript_20281/g.46959 Transcript_20281/m.46959 type:complete len:98 (+) Transcript_20281:485-778(+)